MLESFLNNAGIHFIHVVIFSVPFIYLSFDLCPVSFPMKIKHFNLAPHCSIINAASACNTAVLVFSSGRFNFVQDMELPLRLLLADDLEMLDFLMLLLHLERFHDFCIAFFNQLCTLRLKLNTF